MRLLPTKAAPDIRVRGATDWARREARGSVRGTPTSGSVEATSWPPHEAGWQRRLCRLETGACGIGWLRHDPARLRHRPRGTHPSAIGWRAFLRGRRRHRSRRSGRASRHVADGEQEGLRGQDQFAALAGIDRGRAAAEQRAGAIAHLHETPTANRRPHDQVEFAARARALRASRRRPCRCRNRSAAVSTAPPRARRSGRFVSGDVLSAIAQRHGHAAGITRPARLAQHVAEAVEAEPAGGAGDVGIVRQRQAFQVRGDQPASKPNANRRAGPFAVSRRAAALACEGRPGTSRLPQVSAG